MGDALVETIEQSTCVLGHMGDFVILPYKRFNRFNAVEPHQGQEFDLIPLRSPHQVDMLEADYAPRLDARDYLAADDSLI